MGGVGEAVDGGVAAGRGVEAEDHAESGGLSGAVGAEEAGDGAGADGEAEVLDDGGVPVPLGEVLCSDHVFDGRETAGGVRPTGGGTSGAGVVPGYDGGWAWPRGKGLVRRVRASSGSSAWTIRYAPSVPTSGRRPARSGWPPFRTRSRTSRSSTRTRPPSSGPTPSGRSGRRVAPRAAPGTCGSSWPRAR